jgi:polar amino acid transport system substrate-binding protein
MRSLSMTAKRTTKMIAVLSAAALLTAGCGGGDDTAGNQSGSPSGSVKAGQVDQEAADLLPEDVKASKTLVVAMDATQGKPFTFYAADNKTITGLTKDLSDALGQALGVKMDVKNTSFDSLIPGLQAKRYGLSIAPMLMTDKRLESVDMIGWIHGGSAFMIAKGKGKPDLTLADTCGMTVGAVTGSVEAQALSDQSAQCAAGSKAPISIKLFPHTTDGIVALTAGRIDAYDTAAAQAGYITKGNAQLAQSGEPYNSGTSSMALPKDSDAAQAVTKAFQYLIDQGVYKSILDKYGLSNLAVPSASLNKPV